LPGKYAGETNMPGKHIGETNMPGKTNPAMNCRAIFGCPFGTNPENPLILKILIQTMRGKDNFIFFHYIISFW